MSIAEAMILGIVQGLTEFLPVSSSGHLVILQSRLGLSEPGLTFGVAVHLGSLVAVVVALRQEWLLIAKALLGRAGRENAFGRQLFLLLVVASLPIAVVGYVLRDAISATFASPHVPGAMLLVTGLLLWYADRRTSRGGKSIESLRLRDALWVGVGQALAILPGLSRSGTTMSFGLLAGVDRHAAARFSFLLAVPAIFGAGLLEGFTILRDGVAIDRTTLATGIVASVIASYAAIRLFLAFIRRGRLIWFAWYTWLVGVVVLGLSVTGNL